MPIGPHRSTSSRRRFTPADPAVDCRQSSAVSSAHPRSLSADRVTTQSPRTNGAGASSVGQVAGPALPGLGSRHLPRAVEYRPVQVGAARRTVAPASGPRSPNRDLAPARRRLGQADRPNSAWTSSRGSWSAGVHHRHRPGSVAFRSAPDSWRLERRVVSADRVDRGSFTFNTSARSAVPWPASHAAQPSSGRARPDDCPPIRASWPIRRNIPRVVRRHRSNRFARMADHWHRVAPPPHSDPRGS